MTALIGQFTRLLLLFIGLLDVSLLAFNLPLERVLLPVGVGSYPLFSGVTEYR